MACLLKELNPQGTLESRGQSKWVLNEVMAGL